MNIYEVVSETLYNYVFMLNMDYLCVHRIAHLLAQGKPPQARYLAWKNDDDFTYDLTEMPAFSVHLCMKDVNEKKAHIVTRKEKYQGCWR